jgi:uncharacterized protein YeaO (DUF488 family)
MTDIRLKRVYDKPLETDGFRILVDRLWPRGVSKNNAELDEWAKEIAPSDELRKWFDHAPQRWTIFQRKYKAELKKNESWKDFMKRHKKRKRVTLLYATKEEELTHAVILKKILDKVYAAD